MTNRDYKGRKITVWPVYLDSSEPRSRGRRLSLREAVRKPRVEEIVEAAEELGLNPEVVEASYPRKWWEEHRAIMIDKMGSKTETLRLLASRIREKRARE